MVILTISVVLVLKGYVDIFATKNYTFIFMTSFEIKKQNRERIPYSSLVHVSFGFFLSNFPMIRLPGFKKCVSSRKSFVLPLLKYGELA